jgi:DMSO reductase anchor subunit
MNPAFSVIFLTTLIGAGQGLFLALITAQVYSGVELVTVDEAGYFYALGSVIALVLLLLGLISSIFHLGRPERAWRAATMWRTSWLSREVIALPAFMGMVFIYALIHGLGWDFTVIQVTSEIAIPLSIIIGMIATLLCFVLFLCTGMIYAAIKFLQEWATPLTLMNFTLLGMASGFGLAAVYAFLRETPELINLFAGWALLLTLLAAITRISALIRNSRLKPKTTAKSAIGIRHPKITQMAQGAMGGSFNTREYFHGQTDNIVKLVKWSFLILVFLLPTILLTIALITQLGIFLLVSISLQYVGLIAERWFFFAQANHPQNIYYQAT